MFHIMLSAFTGRPKIPPITYGENGLYVERKDCPHRKIPPYGKAHPHGIVLFILPCPPPTRASAYSSPLACADHDLH